MLLQMHSHRRAHALSKRSFWVRCKSESLLNSPAKNRMDKESSGKAIISELGASAKLVSELMLIITLTIAQRAASRGPWRRTGVEK